MKALTGKKHHLKIAAALLFALTLCVAAAACGGKLPDDHIDLADTFEGEGIVTAEQLVDFIENGTGDTASAESALRKKGEGRDVS